MKKTKILALLCIILSLLLSGCDLSIGGPVEVEVYDAFCDQIEVTGFDDMSFCCYHVPAVRVDDEELVNINRQIYDDLYETAKSYADNSRLNSQPYFISEMSYGFYSHDDLISIVVWERSAFIDYSTNYIYTFNPNEDRLLDDTAVLDVFGYTTSQFLDKLEGQITAYYQEQWGDFYAGYSSQLQMTINSLSDTAIPFVGPNGTLCVAFRFYNVAGAESSDLIWDIETSNFVSLGSCSMHSGLRAAS